LYFKTLTAKSYFFPKEAHEKELDLFVNEINKREKLIDSVYKITDAAIKINLQDTSGQKT